MRISGCGDVNYFLMPLTEGENILDFQSVFDRYRDFVEDSFRSSYSFSYASPYGPWQSFAGVDNIYSLQ